METLYNYMMSSGKLTLLLICFIIKPVLGFYLDPVPKCY